MRRRMSLTAKRSSAYNRAPLRPRWYWPILHLSGIAAGLVAGLATGAWLGWSGTVYAVTTDIATRALDLTGGAGLQVKAVYADGRRHTDRKLLESQLDVALGQPILGFDTAAAKLRLEALPWIQRASVGRLLPDTIKVRLEEHKPLALWQNGGAFSLIDGNGGVIVSGMTASDVGKRFDRLRVLVGDNAPAHAVDLFHMLATEPELSARVKAATWVGDRRWNLRLDNKVDVLLPEKAPLAAWRYLAKAERKKNLLDRALLVIDLRQAPERMRLKLDRAVFGDQQA
ncbi:MAG: cell division protein FtsQ/DivIB [Geminicoccaceae bacterium]